jgi:hypothetical protein
MFFSYSISYSHLQENLSKANVAFYCFVNLHIYIIMPSAKTWTKSLKMIKEYVWHFGMILAVSFEPLRPVGGPRKVMGRKDSGKPQK